MHVEYVEVMYLIKSLGEKHRTAALRKGKVRIGTINYYRQIEDAERADGEEGLGKVVWCGQHLSQENFNKIFSPFDGIEMINGWSIENKGCPILASYPNFNAFVYCYSAVENLGEIASTARGKGDSYFCVANPARFVSSVREKLTPIIRRAVQDRAAPEEREQILNTLEILDVNYRINYDDERKDRLVDEANIDDFNPMAFHPQDFFQKATSYSYEQEVRTVWLPIAKHPITGKDVPLSIPPEWKHRDIKADQSAFSADLIECPIDIETSTVKESGV